MASGVGPVEAAKARLLVTRKLCVHLPIHASKFARRSTKHLWRLKLGSHGGKEDVHTCAPSSDGTANHPEEDADTLARRTTSSQTPWLQYSTRAPTLDYKRAHAKLAAFMICTSASGTIEGKW